MMSFGDDIFELFIASLVSRGIIKGFDISGSMLGLMFVFFSFLIIALRFIFPNDPFLGKKMDIILAIFMCLVGFLYFFELF